MKEILENNNSFNFIVFLSIAIPVVIGAAYAIVTIFG